MKYLNTIILFFTTICFLNAQIVIPSASPKLTQTQKIGITDITLTYSRPAVKDRNIFSSDGLVPHGEYWRLGANSPTTLECSGTIKIGGQTLDKGIYVILANPNAKNWDLHFYKKEKGGWNKYIERETSAVVSAKPINLNHKMESMIIYFDNIIHNTAEMVFHWDNTMIRIPIGVEVHEQVMASINKVMDGPTDFDYFNAASYLNSVDQDLETALKYIQVASKGEKTTFFFLLRESTILAKLGRYREAIQAAKKSNELAETAGNIDAIKINNTSIKEWESKLN